MKRMSRLVSLILLTALAASPQATRKSTPKTSPRETTKWPVQSIVVEGNTNYSDAQILGIVGLKAGQQVSRTALEAICRKSAGQLRETGVFESVAFRFGPSKQGAGYAVVFEIAAIRQVYPIRFENMGAPDKELRAWLKQKDPLFAEKVPGTKELIARYASALEQYLSTKNIKEEVKGELTADKPGEFYIMFYPAGAVPVVAEVDFTGNKVIPAGTLREAIHQVAVGSRYTESRFRQLLDAGVRPLYEARGRVRVAFPKIETERAPGDVKGLKVKVSVDEAQTYNFGKILVEGTLSMNRKLLEAAGLTSGDLANLSEIPAALERINAALRKQGYMRTAARAEHRIHDEKKTVDLVIHADPGPMYSFGKLLIEGLDLHAEHEIRRIWGMKEGDQFDDSYPDYFLTRVREDGVFDNLKKTLSKVRLDDDTRTADVTLIFNPPEDKARFGGP